MIEAHESKEIFLFGQLAVEVNIVKKMLKSKNLLFVGGL